MVADEAMTCISPKLPRYRFRGFTLVELSVVLVIIAVVVGAVTAGSDLLRQASGQRIFSEFVTGWRNAFATYTTQAKVVPGDNPIAPTNQIRGLSGSDELCNSVADRTLTNVMLSQSIQPPEGRGVGEEDRYVYADSNGSPHELRVCFRTVQWAVSGATSGVFVNASRHVMQLTGLTTELALQLDALIDSRLDARFGRFRQTSFADSLSATGVDWPLPKSGSGENNIPEVDAYLLMD